MNRRAHCRVKRALPAPPARGVFPERTVVFKNFLKVCSAALITFCAAGTAHAQASADALVRQISVDVIDTAKADKAIQGGDISRIFGLVEIGRAHV